MNPETKSLVTRYLQAVLNRIDTDKNFARAFLHVAAENVAQHVKGERDNTAIFEEEIHLYTPVAA